MARKNKDEDRKYDRAYKGKYQWSHAGSIYQIGAAAEYQVLADLNWKGLEVTKPTNPSSPHDMHVRMGATWFTLQVKSTGVNTKTGALARRSRKKLVVSEILAWVCPDRTIQYESNTDQPLPAELEEGNVKLFTFTCDACDYVQYKRTTLADRINKEHFCPECGEQMSAGEPVEK